MTYAITPEAARTIGMLLTAGGGSEAILLRRPESELRAELHIERSGRTLTALILLGHKRNTLTLQDGDGANQLNLAEQIEAIANGTADTAETGAIGTATAPAREPFTLCEHDLECMRHLVRIGGTRHLLCEVSVTVHNTQRSERRDALVTTPAGTKHLHGGTPGELFAVAVQHIEVTLDAA